MRQPVYHKYSQSAAAISVGRRCRLQEDPAAGFGREGEGEENPFGRGRVPLTSKGRRRYEHAVVCTMRRIRISIFFLFQRIARKSMRRYCCKDVIADPLLLRTIHHASRADVKIRCRRSWQADCRGADVYFHRDRLLRTFVGPPNVLQEDERVTTLFIRRRICSHPNVKPGPEGNAVVYISEAGPSMDSSSEGVWGRPNACSTSTSWSPCPGMISSDACSQRLISVKKIPSGSRCEANRTHYTLQVLNCEC